MNKQTEDKILEMLLHVHEKSTGAHPLDRAPSISKYGSLIRPYAQIVARALRLRRQ